MRSYLFDGRTEEAKAEKVPVAVLPLPPFDPRIHVSADAKYIVKQHVLWFLALPAVLGILSLVLLRLT